MGHLRIHGQTPGLRNRNRWQEVTSQRKGGQLRERNVKNKKKRKKKEYNEKKGCSIVWPKPYFIEARAGKQRAGAHVSAIVWLM
jgi:hypothetical protein